MQPSSAALNTSEGNRSAKGRPDFDLFSDVRQEIR